MLAPGSSSLAWVMACSRLVAKTMSEPLLVTTLNGSGGGGSGVRALSAMGGVVLPRHHAAGQRLAINGRYKLKQSSPGRASLQWAGIARAMAPSPQPQQQAPGSGWLGSFQMAVAAGTVALLAWGGQQQLEQAKINQQMAGNMSMTTDKLDELCKRTQKLEEWRHAKDAQDAKRDAQIVEHNARLNSLERRR